jgi:hypothetical protein
MNRNPVEFSNLTKKEIARRRKENALEVMRLVQNGYNDNCTKKQLCATIIYLMGNRKIAKGPIT